MSTEDTIIEEENQNADLKQGKNNFSRKMGNALRRSKRMLSGKRKSVKSASSIEQSEKSPLSEKKNTSLDDNQLQSIDTTDTNGEVSPRGRRPSQTFFSPEKQVEIDGRKHKEIEIVGQKSNEPIDMKKQKKLVRKKSLDQSELNIACRDLGKADFEGWLQKKSGGHGLVPVSWKRYWCVMKDGKLYCYKTSFDIAADYGITINSYTVEKTEEKKKKIAFKLVPNSEDFKQAVFAGDSEEDVNAWVELINKVLSGIDVSQTNDDKVPEYEERHRMYSTNLRSTDESLNNGRTGSVRHKQRMSSAFAVETETTGMPAGFGARTQSTSQPRVRKMSSGGTKPESCLAVGSMFKSLDVEDDEPGSPQEDADLKGLLFKEVEVETEVTPQNQSKEVEIAKLNAEIAKLNDDMLVLNKDGERKSTDQPETVEPSKPVEIPTVQVDETQDNQPDSDVGKSEVNEDALEVSGQLTAQERSTSQIFRDFETATANDPIPAAVEVPAEVKVEESPKVDEDVVDEVEIPVVQPKERPPTVEEDDIVETRKSTEIDAETVITELEQQQKKEEENNQDDNEVIVTDIQMNIVTEDEDDEVSKDENKTDNDVKEKLEESTLSESLVSEQVDVSEQTSVSEVSEQQTPEPKAVVQQDNPEVTEAEEPSTPEAAKETPEAVAEAPEAVKETEEAVEETPEEVKETEEPVEVAPEAVKETEEVAKETEKAVKETEEAVKETSEAVKVTEETPEASVETSEEPSTPVETPDTDASKEQSTPEANMETSEAVVSEEPKAAETTESISEETTVVVTEQPQAENQPTESTQVTTVETITEDGQTVEITTIETTETIIVDDNSPPEINVDESKAKTYSVDLGEDLDIPALNGDTSLSDEINIQLSSPTTTTTEQSFTLETNKPQVNGDATHVISVN